MLTVTMVRKADYSGYRLFITPEMEGYPTDENQAAAYMNKIIEKEIMRAPEQYLWIHRRFKTRPGGRIVVVHLTNCSYSFPPQIGHNNLMVFMAFFLRFFLR